MQFQRTLAPNRGPLLTENNDGSWRHFSTKRVEGGFLGGQGQGQGHGHGIAACNCQCIFG